MGHRFVFLSPDRNAYEVGRVENATGSIPVGHCAPGKPGGDEPWRLFRFETLTDARFHHRIAFAFAKAV